MTYIQRQRDGETERRRDGERQRERETKRERGERVRERGIECLIVDHAYEGYYVNKGTGFGDLRCI